MTARITLPRKTGCSKIIQSFLIKNCIFCCNILFLITRISEQLKTTCYGCHTLFTLCVASRSSFRRNSLRILNISVVSLKQINVLIKTWQTQLNMKTAQLRLK